MAKDKKRNKYKDKMDANRERRDAEASGFSYLRLPKGVQVFKPIDHFGKKEDSLTVLLDFLPYRVTDKGHPERDEANNVAIEGTEWWRRPFLVHKNVGTANETLVCRRSAGKKCPICEFVAEERKKGTDWDELREVAAKKRELYIVVPLNIEGLKKEPMIYDDSTHLFWKVLDKELRDAPENRGFMDLEEGLSVRVRYSREKYNKFEYAATDRVDFKERKKGYDEDILDETPNLDEVLIVQSYEDMDAKFMEIEDDEDSKSKDKKKSRDDDDDDDDKKSSKKKSREDDDDDDDDNKKSSKKKRQDDDDDDDDDDKKESKKKRQDDDDEEEGRKLKKRSKSDDDDDDDNKKSSKKKRQEDDDDDKTGKCPHGHKWGADCDLKDECVDCKKWDDCVDAKKAQRRGRK
jgi:hypothetical protein